jgi:apolipoprotein N-acyltransferase
LIRPVEPLALNGWQAIDTHYPRLQNEDVDFSADYLRHQDIRRLVDTRPGPAFMVFPEGAGGYWTEAAGDWWEVYDRHLADQGRTLLFGAEIPQPDGGYINAIVVLGQYAHEPLAQRMPVPVAMWQPWHAAGARASWFASGVDQIGPTRVAYVICYEQFILWPLLISFSQQPQALVAVANNWWARDTPIPEQQRAIMTSWSRLFHIPLIQAVNR